MAKSIDSASRQLRSPYTLDDVYLVLRALAFLGGNMRRTARALRDGGHRISLKTIERWSQRQYPEAYAELRLGRQLLEGASADALSEAAERAGWDPPKTLTAVLIPESQVRSALAALDAGTLRLPAELVGDDGAAILLVPDAAGPRRTRLLRVLEGRDAVVGPDRDWIAVGTSVQRARRIQELITADRGAPVDTEAHLATLIVQSDAEALADLRRRVLEPLSELHPQTVRYRMAQVRGDVRRSAARSGGGP